MGSLLMKKTTLPYIICNSPNLSKSKEAGLFTYVITTNNKTVFSWAVLFKNPQPLVLLPIELLELLGVVSPVPQTAA